jgi:serine/threonine protein kinase
MGDAPQDSRVGTQIGPYRLIRLLGRGGMGEVYEAYDTVKDRVVALKLIKPELSSDSTFRRRMEREAHTAGQLREPHVVPIHNYGELDGQLYIDMRFVQGTDLSDTLHTRGPLPPPEAVAIVSQIASALDAAHAAGVLHRDVKPENIMIAEDDFAYLVDFGIAAAAFDERLTQTGAAIGTWKYLSPERFSNGEATYRADIYALACVLFECLTGAAPYESDSSPALMAAHLMQPVPRPSQTRPGIPTALDAVIAQGMAKDPADRYTRAGDLAHAAHNALTSADQHQASEILQRNQTFTPPAPFGPQSRSQFPTAPTFPPHWGPPPPRNRNRWVLVATAVVVVSALTGLGVWFGTRDTGGGGRSGPRKTTTTTTTAAPTLDTAQLTSMLLSPAEINNIMGATSIILGTPTTEMVDLPNTLSNPACNGPMNAVQAVAYAGSGYTAVSAQLLHEPGERPNHDVVQAAVAFPSAAQAGAVLKNATAQWKACAGQSVTMNADGQVYTYTFGQVAETASKITLGHTAVGGSGFGCQHALSVVSSIVIDAAVCGFQITDQASRIVDGIAANAPK